MKNLFYFVLAYGLIAFAFIMIGKVVAMLV